MEDSKETVKDARYAVDNSVTMMMDTEEENEESTHPMVDAQDEEPPQFEGTGARSIHSKDDPNPENNDCPELTKEGHLLEEQGVVETPVVVDAKVTSNVDPPIALSAEDDMREESKHVVTEVESPQDNETKEEEMNNEVTGVGPLSDNDKEERLNNGMTTMELPVDTEIMEEESNNVVTGMELTPYNGIKEELPKQDLVHVKSSNNSFLLAPNAVGDESGTEEDQAAFMKELETFHKERCLEFKPPRFYGEPLNCLKLWRAVVRLGGYEQVTSCKLWRQVGESFKPPKTCTTVSWTFRCFYEKALLEYEKHKMRCGELPFNDVSFTEPTSAGNQVGHNQASGSGRARRDAAARAMQGWHSQRLLGNGEVGDPIIKDKNSTSTPKREKQLKSIGLLKRKKSSPVERAVKVARLKASKPQLDTMVVDIGPPADWVKINVQKTKDCFEVYALVPGLLREEVRVQSDPAGRLVISGQPEQLDNPWGVTPFKKVVSLPSRIDPHQTSAVVTLHGQLFVRVPFEQSDL
ncbi:AT-rich interactive domain-containing protein 5-like [Cornus florida]|uniref:AT-rich interactive domain-containing protein 5-like n=1 Tax=Cornus florida TaxID=4283 RepID=UPI0028A11695|nr:AT-rich interactive domain-containing protein 5-like [Cornus florida]XP_059647345.1 AT-rich interactive domain-containing protein 5-like [Cornus florida]XP_059647346.1 AT-rich interactive domain-containing protein 5-like [Cornus florida]